MRDLVGRVVLDSSGQVIEANDVACLLLQFPAVVAKSCPALSQLVAAGGAGANGEAVQLPCSHHRLLRLSDDSRRGFLFHYCQEGEHVVATFEPADRFFQSFDQLRVAVAVTNQDGTVVYVNQAASDLYGVPIGRMLGRNAYALAERVTVNAADLPLVFSAVMQGRPLTDAFSLRTVDGRHRRFVFNTSEWLYCGLPCGVIWCLTDVTEQYEHEREAATGVWYRVAATFQHEIRNPLQTMQAALELLRPLQSEEGARLVSLLERQVNVVGDYLLDQLQPPTLASQVPARLSDVVQAELDRSAIRISTRQLTFVHKRPQDEPLVLIHPTSMGRVFANLFRNTAQAQPDAVVHITYDLTPNGLTCVVADNGPGFLPGTLHAGVLGQRQEPLDHLGLAIVRATVEAHRGTVTVGNGPEGGACITLRLPAAKVPGVTTSDHVSLGLSIVGDQVGGAHFPA